MKQHSLALLDPDRVAETQAAAVDREIPVCDLEPVWMRISLLAYGRFVYLTAILFFLRRCEVRLPFVSREKDLLVIAACVVFWFDIHEGELAGESAAIQVVHGHCVRMHVSGTAGCGSDPVAEPAIRRHNQAAFFGGAVDIGRDVASMPVDIFRLAGLVENVDGCRDTFAKA